MYGLRISIHKKNPQPNPPPAQRRVNHVFPGLVFPGLPFPITNKLSIDRSAIHVITVRSSPEFYSDYCEIGVLSSGTRVGASLPKEQLYSSSTEERPASRENLYRQMWLFGSTFCRKTAADLNCAMKKFLYTSY